MRVPLREFRHAQVPGGVAAVRVVQAPAKQKQILEQRRDSLPRMLYALETVVAERASEEAWQLSKDELDRVKMRLDGLGTYAVVSALVVNMGIRLVSATSEDLMSRVWLPIACSYCAALAVCVLSGVYATIVFTLTKMYSKTAIGIYRDSAFTEFFRQTARYRQSGFLAFCVCLASFAFAFVSFFLLKVRGVPGCIGFIVGLSLVCRSMKDFHGIYSAARRIFS